MERIWAIFRDLDAARPSGMGLSPISYQDIAAYRALTHTPLNAWQVQLIRRLDVTVLRVQAAQDGQAPTSSSVAVNDAGGLRSLFKGIGARRRRK